jgi:hypothetical protein
MTKTLTPHLAVLAAIACLIGFGVVLDRPEIGTAIGVAIALSLNPLVILSAVVIGFWFVPYRQFLLASIACALVLQLIALWFFAPHPITQKLNLTPDYIMLMRGLGFISLAHVFHAARTIFKTDH